jgi:hypothetical protein
LFNQQQCFIYSTASKEGRKTALKKIFFFYLWAKLEIVVPESDSGISFSKFPASRHLF